MLFPMLAATLARAVAKFPLAGRLVPVPRVRWLALYLKRAGMRKLTCQGFVSARRVIAFRWPVAV